jgi:hypothetical protein
MLLFLVGFAFSDSSTTSRKDRTRSDLMTPLRPDGMSVNDMHLACIKKTWLRTIDSRNFRLCEDNIKILAANSFENQRIISFNHEVIVVKAIEIQRFYYLYFHLDPDDPPFIS